MTLEQVKSFSEAAGITMVRDWGMTVVNGTITLAVVGLIILLCFEIRKVIRENKGKKNYLGMFLGAFFFTGFSLLAMVFGSITINDLYVPAEGEEIAYKAQQTKWQKEYVEPYLAALPTEKSGISQIEYDYVMGEKQTKTYLEESFETPIKAVTESGEKVQGWAKIKPLAEGESERIEFKRLGEELAFGAEKYRKFLDSKKEYPAGYYYITVHTNKLK